MALEGRTKACTAAGTAARSAPAHAPTRPTGPHRRSLRPDRAGASPSCWDSSCYCTAPHLPPLPTAPLVSFTGRSLMRHRSGRAWSDLLPPAPSSSRALAPHPARDRAQAVVQGPLTQLVLGLTPLLLLPRLPGHQAPQLRQGPHHGRVMRAATLLTVSLGDLVRVEALAQHQPAAGQHGQCVGDEARLVGCGDVAERQHHRLHRLRRLEGRHICGVVSDARAAARLLCEGARLVKPCLAPVNSCHVVARLS
mmetsp:Transcript_12212/g.29760  ORF Transcript_12212/g.29760 Transcript_12212/m.29760 type:complete len:252 (-) Transcript_12212:226-981(-)